MKDLGLISKLYAALFGFRMLPIMAMSKSGQVDIVSDHHQSQDACSDCHACP